MILEQNKQNDNEKDSASPLKTEEIISILNKTNNEKFSREDKISSNISSNFKGFSLKQIAKRLEKEVIDKENITDKNNEDIVTKQLQRENKEEGKTETIEKIIEEEKVYTKEEAKKISDDLSKKSYDNGHKTGYEEGVKKIKEELQKGEEAIALALKNTIDNLFHIAPTFLEKLNININNSIKEICNQIVGYEISEFPEKFVKKIEDLSESVNNSSNKIKIYLNKDDLSAVTKYLSKEEVLTDASFLEGKDLNRGDLIVKSGGIEINDIVSSKVELISESNIEKELKILKEENKSLKEDLNLSPEKEKLPINRKRENDPNLKDNDKKKSVPNPEQMTNSEIQNSEQMKSSEDQKNSDLLSDSNLASKTQEIKNNIKKDIK